MRCTPLKYFAAAVLFLLSCNTSFSQEVLTVIGNAKGVPSELKLGQLQSVLKGEKQRWGDGTKVVVALMKTNTAVGSTTSKKILNMSGDQLNKHWLGLVFQGKADAPSFFNSMSELETFVAQTPGAIGVVSSSASGGKIVLVDGKKSL